MTQYSFDNEHRSIGSIYTIYLKEEKLQSILPMISSTSDTDQLLRSSYYTPVYGDTKRGGAARAPTPGENISLTSFNLPLSKNKEKGGKTKEPQQTTHHSNKTTSMHNNKGKKKSSVFVRGLVRGFSRESISLMCVEVGHYDGEVSSFALQQPSRIGTTNLVDQRSEELSEKTSTGGEHDAENVDYENSEFITTLEDKILKKFHIDSYFSYVEVDRRDIQRTDISVWSKTMDTASQVIDAEAWVEFCSISTVLEDVIKALTCKFLISNEHLFLGEGLENAKKRQQKMKNKQKEETVEKYMLTSKLTQEKLARYISDQLYRLLLPPLILEGVHDPEQKGGGIEDAPTQQRHAANMVSSSFNQCHHIVYESQNILIKSGGAISLEGWKLIKDIMADASYQTAIALSDMLFWLFAAIGLFEWGLVSSLVNMDDQSFQGKNYMPTSYNTPMWIAMMVASIYIFLLGFTGGMFSVLYRSTKRCCGWSKFMLARRIFCVLVLVAVIPVLILSLMYLTTKKNIPDGLTVREYYQQNVNTSYMCAYQAAHNCSGYENGLLCNASRYQVAYGKGSSATPTEAHYVSYYQQYCPANCSAFWSAKNEKVKPIYDHRNCGPLLESSALSGALQVFFFGMTPILLVLLWGWVSIWAKGRLGKTLQKNAKEYKALVSGTAEQV